jgi:hypothetical protein
MGEPPKRGDGSDPSSADHAALIDALKSTERTVARAPRATVKGMVPLERPPAPTGSDTPDE